jgi:hypothetical protein
LIFAFATHAAFEDVEVGARPLSMGRAFVAVADDPNAIYWNPAGLPEVRGFQLSGTRAWLFGVDGLHSDYVACKLPRWRAGDFGIAWTSTVLEGVLSENTFILSHGRKLAGPVNVGFNLKYYRIDASGYEKYNDPAYRGAQSSFGCDVGLLLRPWEELSIGLSGRNLNEPALQLLDTTEDPDRVNRSFRAGLAYKFREVVLLSSELRSRRDFEDMEFSIGTEIWFYESYAVRVGSGAGRQNVGLGIWADHWRADFALINHRILDNSYRLSFTVIY